MVDDRVIEFAKKGKN